MVVELTEQVGDGDPKDPLAQKTHESRPIQKVHALRVCPFQLSDTYHSARIKLIL